LEAVWLLGSLLIYPLNVGALFSEDSLRRLYSISSRNSSKNARIPIWKYKPIGLIKWGKVGLENLPVSHLLQKKN
jgi:hypothetical protein